MPLRKEQPGREDERRDGRNEHDVADQRTSLTGYEEDREPVRPCRLRDQPQQTKCERETRPKPQNSGTQRSLWLKRENCSAEMTQSREQDGSIEDGHIHIGVAVGCRVPHRTGQAPQDYPTFEQEEAGLAGFEELPSDEIQGTQGYERVEAEA